MKKVKSILGICLMTVIFSSCEKGDTGPQGSQGPQGETGNTGPQGPQGNANCQYFPLSFALSSYHRLSSNNCYYKAATGLPSVSSNDMLLVYLYERWDGSNFEWGAIPGKHFYSTGSSYNYHYFSITNSGTAYVYIRNSSGIQPYNTMSGSLKYRFFIIKDALRIGSRSAIPEWLDINDINEVIHYYGIQGLSK